MPEILINVINKIPQLSGDVRQITADNGDYTIRLVFDDDWTASTKTVLFVRENGFVYPTETTKNDTVTVPAVIGVPVREWLYVGVMQGNVRTSRPCGIPVYRSITDMIADDAVQPEPSMWEDILARVEWLEKHGGGSGGTALPPITETDDGKVLMASGGEWVAAELPKYDGVYAVTPSTAAAKVLDTGQKFVDADIRVEKIPYYEIDNTSGGLTVYIGSDDEITFE